MDLGTCNAVRVAVCIHRYNSTNERGCVVGDLATKPYSEGRMDAGLAIVSGMLYGHRVRTS